MVDIKRINLYDEKRFSQHVLNQHGCFLVNENRYEVQIITPNCAIIRGKDKTLFNQIIDEFRFYSPEINRFVDANGNTVREFPVEKRFKILIN